MNEIFGIEYSGSDRSGAAIKGTKTYPAYSCGHCSQTVIMRDDRTRPRTTCQKCNRWLCEQNELCQVDCTPIYDIAKDHSWEDPKWGKLVPAIMAGATTKEEAYTRLLLKE